MKQETMTHYHYTINLSLSSVLNALLENETGSSAMNCTPGIS